MCIIVAKPKGQDVPSKEILKQCFTKNPDGAGMMYPVKVKDGKVLEITEEGGESSIYIDNGFMDFE